MANIPNITDPKEAFLYVQKCGKRIPELEPVIFKSGLWTYYYLKLGYGPEASDPEEAFNRAYLSGKISPKLESIILQSPKYSSQYAYLVLKNRWLAGEPVILSEPMSANEYMCFALKHQNLNNA